MVVGKIVNGTKPHHHHHHHHRCRRSSLRQARHHSHQQGPSGEGRLDHESEEILLRLEEASVGGKEVFPTTELKKLFPPDVFGAEVVLNADSVSAGSVVADTFVEVLALSRKQINRWPFTDEMMEQLRCHTMKYPEDDETQRKIEDEAEWEKYKVCTLPVDANIPNPFTRPLLPTCKWVHFAYHFCTRFCMSRLRWWAL
jgi:hypothetical protein